MEHATLSLTWLDPHRACSPQAAPDRWQCRCAPHLVFSAYPASARAPARVKTGAKYLRTTHFNRDKWNI